MAASIYANLLEHKKRVQLLTGLVWDTNMATMSLFWDTNMAVVTSFEHTLLVYILVCILVKVMKIFFNIFFTEKKNLKRSASLPGMSNSVSAVIVGMMIRAMATRMSIKQYI